jgi:hypothetical protein
MPMLMIGRRTLWTGDGTFGGECRLLSAITTMVEEGIWMQQFPEMNLTGAKLYGLHLRERVARRLRAKLDERARLMNKKCGRRYVHWTNAEGRYFDEGE